MDDVSPQLASLVASYVAAADTPITIAAVEPDMPLVYVNAAFERMTGYRRQDVLGRNCRFLQGPGTDRATVHAVGESVRAGRFTRARLLNYRADGTDFWNELHISAVRDSAGSVTGYLGVMHDATDEVAVVQRAVAAATRDPLTGLANRAAFAMEAERELARASRHGERVAVLFLDIDRFKAVNDTHGHLVGDALLVHVAEVLRRRLRAEDVAARQGGDEFTVLLTALPDDGVAAHVSQELQAALAEPVTVDGVAFRISVTIGAAVAPRDGSTVRELIARADADMYRHKARRT